MFSFSIKGWPLTFISSNVGWLYDRLSVVNGLTTGFLACLFSFYFNKALNVTSSNIVLRLHNGQQTPLSSLTNTYDKQFKQNLCSQSSIIYYYGAI